MHDGIQIKSMSVKGAPGRCCLDIYSCIMSQIGIQDTCSRDSFWLHGNQMSLGRHLHQTPMAAVIFIMLMSH